MEGLHSRYGQSLNQVQYWTPDKKKIRPTFLVLLQSFPIGSNQPFGIDGLDNRWTA